MGNSSKKQTNKEPESRVTEQDKAVLQLKQMRDKIKQYKKKIETQLAKDRELAKMLIQSGKVDKAKLLLKKKKFYENNLDKADAQIDNLEQLCHSLEYTQIEHKVVESLKVGNDCLKKLNEMMSLEAIEDLMDDTRESVEYQQKVTRLISGEFADINQEEDDEAINDELERILADQLPQVPDEKLPELEQQKSKEKPNIAEKSSAKKTMVLAE